MIKATCFCGQLNTQHGEEILNSKCTNCGGFIPRGDWVNEYDLPVVLIKKEIECGRCGKKFYGEGWKRLCLDCYKNKRAI